MTDRAAAFQAWFAIPPSAARILTALHGVGGRPLDVGTLMIAGGQTYNGVMLSVKLLRNAMDEGSLRCVFKQGYHLTAIGIADCEKALADAAERAA